MNQYIFQETEKLVKKFKTRDPLKILQGMNVVVKESNNFHSLKGYCFMSCKTIYVVLNAALCDEMKRIVAAHELGHIILHRQHLSLAPMNDVHLYNSVDKAEYEANLFAADLLLSDKEIKELAKNEEVNYFSMCSELNVSPELMSFKLFSLTKRGYHYRVPLDLNGGFLAKQV